MYFVIDVLCVAAVGVKSQENFPLWTLTLVARRAKSLGQVDRCPGVFSEGSVSIPVLDDLSERVGL